MIEVEFIGAARTVTGSKHWIRTSRASVLLDCGLFQGHRKEAQKKNLELPLQLSGLDAVVLSHAHIDHSGALPVLYKRGYRGPIFLTPATRDLCSPMLLDTAALMKSDADHIQKLIQRGARGIEAIPPLYDSSDVMGVLSLMIGIPYHRRQQIAPGIWLSFLDAGHVLGSAISVLDIEDGSSRVRLAYTGDLGRKHIPIIRDPEVPEGVQWLLMESTYGDRLHGPIEQTSGVLAEVINRTVSRGGKVIIPSFALERAQEVVFELKRLLASARIPEIPVYVDSPLTVKLTDVFKLHPELYDPPALAFLKQGDSPFEFPGLSYISSVEDSKRIDRDPEPAVIISASGMCEGGRVLHHLAAAVSNPMNTVLIVGYQAEHTLGRRLVEGQTPVKIFGMPYALSCEISVLNGLSAHADEEGLLAFAKSVRENGRLRRISLVHGEPASQDALSKRLSSLGFQQVSAPRPGDRVPWE